MSEPLISCIVPVYNNAQYVAEALDSIFAQTYRPLEVIVVDDGSTDDTAAVVGRYSDRVTYIRQANGGPALARNRGLAAARGEFVAFLDADDWWHPEKLARQMARFAERPETGVWFTFVKNVLSPEFSGREAEFAHHRVGEELAGYQMQAMLARRSAFERVGPLNASLHHADATDWCLRAAEAGVAIDIVPEVLAFRRIHKCNISNAAAGKSLDEHLELLKRSLDLRRRAGGGTISEYRFPGLPRLAPSPPAGGARECAAVAGPAGA
jgi:glycosyltransferase involved in cell wall biosynthesis